MLRELHNHDIQSVACVECVVAKCAVTGERCLHSHVQDTAFVARLSRCRHFHYIVGVAYRIM